MMYDSFFSLFDEELPDLNVFICTYLLDMFDCVHLFFLFLPSFFPYKIYLSSSTGKEKMGG